MIKNLTLLFLLYLLPLGVHAESAREYFKFAKFSYDTKEYIKALDYVNKAIEVDPNYISGFLLRAEINFGLNKFDQVINDITRAFNLDKNAYKTMSEFHLLRGDAYIKLNELNKALRDINYCIGLNPNNAKAFFLKGIINTEKEMYFEAVENFDQAIRLDADESNYYFRRAELKKLYYKPIAGTKTYESIMADITICTALDPNDYRPHKLKCDMLKLDAGYDKEDLIDDLSVMIDHFPEQSEFYAERGLANVLINKYGSALKDFTKAIELDAFNEANYRNRALCLHNMNRYEDALGDYTSSVEILVKKYQSEDDKEAIKKTLAQTLTMRGMTYQFNGNSDQACEDYYNAAKLGSKVGLNNYRKNCNVYN